MRKYKPYKPNTYYERNKEKVVRRTHEWQKRNRERYRAYQLQFYYENQGLRLVQRCVSYLRHREEYRRRREILRQNLPERLESHFQAVLEAREDVDSFGGKTETERRDVW